jgi:hypothetical protein
MAFIDFAQPAAILPATTAVLVVPTMVEEFSPLEQRVIELSHDDGLESLQPPRERSWLKRLLFGPPPPSRRLANERLEALRRLAVEARHRGWQIRPSAISAARLVGFSDAQIGRVIDTIGSAPLPTLAQRNFA